MQSIEYLWYFLEALYIFTKNGSKQYHNLYCFYVWAQSICQAHAYIWSIVLSSFAWVQLLVKGQHDSVE